MGASFFFFLPITTSSTAQLASQPTSQPTTRSASYPSYPSYPSSQAHTPTTHPHYTNQPSPTMQEIDVHYPPEACPFCTIAAAHPCPPDLSTAPASLWRSADEKQQDELHSCVPADDETEPTKTSPSSFVVLRSRDVVAFLDILPMTGGEFFFLPIFLPPFFSLLILFLYCYY